MFFTLSIRGFLTGVFPHVQELKDVAVPGLHVDGKGTLPLSTALVDVPSDANQEGGEQKCGKQCGEV